MRKASILRYGAIAACSTFVIPTILAQNAIRPSQRASFRRRHRARSERGHFQ
ncbi:MAG: hypothetical protein QOE55_8120 [Acidobacteriaceae bacterium]|jgi:hypothetical protein|nr:hypothetical protein [Acidobacteriaceae bacterium]